MKTEFTAGPWIIQEHDNYWTDSGETEHHYGIDAGELKPYLSAEDAEKYPNIQHMAYENTVVSVSTDRDYGHYEAGIGKLADARLIAASPDLYAALLPFVEHGTCFESEHIQAAKAALAKARGEPLYPPLHGAEK